MSKNKGEIIDSFFVDKKTKKIRQTQEKVKAKKAEEKQKKKNIKTKSKDKLAQNEIVIDMPKNVVKKKNTLKKVSAKSNKKEKIKKTKTVKKQNTKNKKSYKEHSKSNKKFKALKIIILIILLIMIVAIVLFSKIFNVREIKIQGNSKVTNEEILSLSEIEENTNIFKITRNSLEKKLKKNSYIEKVTISKNLESILTINVEERKPTYLLILGDEFVYINNQGYILEVSSEELNLPKIEGYKTDINKKIASEDEKRLDNKDLEKLDVILRIISEAARFEIEDKITRIDISNSNEYTLILENEMKTIMFGKDEYINDKIIRIKKMIEKEEGIEGIFFIQDIHKVYFREKV